MSKSPIQKIPKHKTNKTNILFISDFQKGGGAESVMNNNILLLEQTHQFNVRHIKCANHFNLFKSRIAKFFYKIKCLLFGPFLLAYLLITSPQVIHIYEFMHGMFIPTIPSLIIYKKIKPNTKIIISAHSPFLTLEYFNTIKSTKNPLKFFPAPFVFIYFKLLKFGKYVNTITTPSKHMAIRIKKFFQHFKTPVKVRTIYNPLLNYQLIRTITSKQAPLPSIPPIKLVFVGRFDKLKQPLKFVKFIHKVIKIYKKRKQKLPFIIQFIGDGPLFTEVQNYTHKHKLNKYLKLLGRQTHEKTLQIMHNSHALVMYSIPKEENAPLVLTESALLNIYLLLPKDYGGIEEFGQKYTASFWFEYNKPNTFIFALEQLASQLTKSKKRPRSQLFVNKLQKEVNPQTFLQQITRIYTKQE